MSDSCKNMFRCWCHLRRIGKCMSLILAVCFAPTLWIIPTAAIADSAEQLGTYTGDSLEWFVSAPDGSTFALAIRSGATVSVYQGQSKLGTYQSAFNPLYSANGKSFAFLAIDGSNAFFVVNGKRMPDLHSASAMMAAPELIAASATGIGFSFDGTSFAYRDSVPGPAAPPLGPGAFSIDPVAMYVNGKPEAAHLEVGPPLYNPVKNELVYRVRDAASVPPPTPPKKLSYLIRGGSAQTAYWVLTDPAVFSPDGSRIAYAASVDTGNFVPVIDGKNGSEYLFLSGFAFSPNSKRVAFIAGPYGQGQMAVIDGRAESTFPSVDPVVFSPDSSKYAYIANTNLSIVGGPPNESVLIVNGAEAAREKGARAIGPYFTPQNTVGYLLQAGARVYVKTGAKQEGPYAWASFPAFSGDASHTAYATLDGISHRFRMVIDGVATDGYSGIGGWRFTAARSLEYLAAQSDGQFTVIRVRKTL